MACTFCMLRLRFRYLHRLELLALFLLHSSPCDMNPAVGVCPVVSSPRIRWLPTQIFLPDLRSSSSVLSWYPSGSVLCPAHAVCTGTSFCLCSATGTFSTVLSAKSLAGEATS